MSTVKASDVLLVWSRRSYMAFFGAAFFGSAFLAVPLKSFSLFPARVLLAVTWALVISWLLAGGGRREIQENRHLLIFFGFWLAWGAVSLLWATDRGAAGKDLYHLFAGISLPALAVFVKPRECRILGRMWLAAAGLLVLIGLIEHTTLHHLPVSRLFDNPCLAHVSYRPTGFFQNENNYASFLALSFPFLFAAWRYSPNRWQKILTGLTVFAGIYLLLVSASRLNYFGLLLAIVLWSLIFTPRGRRLQVFLMLMSAVAAVSLFVEFVQPNLQGILAGQFQSLANAARDWLRYRDLEYVVAEQSIAVRINFIRNGLAFLKDSYGLGIGPGNFKVLIAKTPFFGTLGHVHPHNWWLELAVEYGILVAVTYCLLFGKLLAGVYANSHHPGESQWLGGAVALAMMIFPLVALAPSTCLTYNPQWQLLALAVMVGQCPGDRR